MAPTTPCQQRPQAANKTVRRRRTISRCRKTTKSYPTANTTRSLPTLEAILLDISTDGVGINTPDGKISASSLKNWAAVPAKCAGDPVQSPVNRTALKKSSNSESPVFGLLRSSMLGSGVYPSGAENISPSGGPSKHRRCPAKHRHPRSPLQGTPRPSALEIDSTCRLMGSPSPIAAVKSQSLWR